MEIKLMNFDIEDIEMKEVEITETPGTSDNIFAYITGLGVGYTLWEAAVAFIAT